MIWMIISPFPTTSYETTDWYFRFKSGPRFEAPNSCDEEIHGLVVSNFEPGRGGLIMDEDDMIIFPFLGSIRILPSWWSPPFHSGSGSGISRGPDDVENQALVQHAVLFFIWGILIGRVVASLHPTYFRRMNQGTPICLRNRACQVLSTMLHSISCSWRSGSISFHVPVMLMPFNSLGDVTVHPIYTSFEQFMMLLLETMWANRFRRRRLMTPRSCYTTPSVFVISDRWSFLLSKKKTFGGVIEEINKTHDDELSNR